MTGDTTKTAAVALFVPFAMLLSAIAFVELTGRFGADPDYVYLLNGLNILRLDSPGHIDHPGTPLQLLGAVVIGITWLARSISQGAVSLQDDVLLHPELYLRCINWTLALLSAGAASFLGRRLLSGTGSFVVAIVAQVTVLLSLPVMISLPRVTPEPLLLSLTLVLAALLSPAMFRPSLLVQNARYPLLIGATLGTCVATKITAVPLVLTVALLGGRKKQVLAIAAAAAAALVLTLPIASRYGAFLQWVSALAIHSGNYGEAAVGLPSVAELGDRMKLLFDAFPGAFVSVAICGVLLACLPGNGTPDRPACSRFFLICAIVISAQLLLVAKHFGERYLLPAAAIAALANAGAVHVVTSWKGARRAGFAAAMMALLALGLWHTGRAVSDWYGAAYAIRTASESLMARVAGSGCALIPYYGASSEEFNLWFGDRFAKGVYARRLAALYPHFLSHNGLHFEDFIGVLDPAEADRRLAKYKCIYLFGSPLERFDNRFGIPRDELSLVARTDGSLGEALAVYRLSRQSSDRPEPQDPQQ